MFAEQRISILQCSNFPPFLMEVIREKSNRRSLFAIPSSHPPQTLKDGLFLESKIEKTAIDWILHIAFRIFIPSDHFELSFLRGISMKSRNLQRQNIPRRSSQSST